MSKFEERMRLGWHGGLSDGTVCGKGSTLANTQSVRERLPDLVLRHGFQSICDAGAGDGHWMQHIDWFPLGILYRAYDLVPRRPGVTKLDIRIQCLPLCDLIICRQVLNHLEPAGVLEALEQFRLSGRYLLATQHDRWNANGRQSADYTEWNLEQPPFNLGPPIESIPEEVHPNCFLSLWDLHRAE